MTKPPRTLGISLAILAAVCLFSCLPLFQAIILLNLRLSPTQEVISGGGDETNTAPLIMGTDISLVDTTPLILQAVVAVLFLVIAILTWRGRPSFMRFVFVGAVLLLTAGNLTLLFNSLNTPPATPLTGMDSSADLARTLTVGQLCGTLLIPLYVVWYLNRGPARAFFRGRFLSTSDGS